MAAAGVSPARRAAFDILFRVHTRDAYSSELLHSDLVARLSPVDRGLTTELVMGVLRWQQKLDSALEEAAQKSIAKFDVEVKVALRLAAYQSLFLQRIPARAAVNESVELVKVHGKRSAAPLVNAVLRRVSPQSKDVDRPKSTSSIADAYSHPSWLVERWAQIYGIEAATSICSYNQQRPTTTIRVDAQKISSPSVIESIQKRFDFQGVILAPASIVKNAWRVVSGDLTTTREYQHRLISVQEEGSQLVGLLARGERILDCCAAPGGKSAIAAERNPSAFIVAMDLHLHRAQLMRKLHPAFTVVAGDARQLPFAGHFDSLMADLPCTGTGTLSRNPEIKWRLKPDDLLRMAELQLQILSSASEIADGIVHSTCSLEPEEGEKIIAKFLSRSRNFRVVPIRNELEKLAAEGKINADSINSLVRGDFLRTIPGIHPCDGFFAAILERY